MRITLAKKSAALPNVIATFSSPLLTASALTSNADVSSHQIRDAKNQLILDTAIAAGADILLTGDKDFHVLGLHRPSIMTPAAFLDEFISEEVE